MVQYCEVGKVYCQALTQPVTDNLLFCPRGS